MHSCIGNKKSEWIWIAVDRLNKIFINCVIGTRGSKTGTELWEKISDVAVGKVMTDHWKAYNEFVPHEKHICSKAQTYTVEGYNRIFRHFLARLRRRTICYNKSKKILLLSIKLLMAK
ncbi:MAG: hypothetical protein RLZZ293_1201 [Pseudomonadota bacterium]|jgi:insertion element IS1 protein InsB